MALRADIKIDTSKLCHSRLETGFLDKDGEFGMLEPLHIFQDEEPVYKEVGNFDDSLYRKLDL